MMTLLLPGGVSPVPICALNHAVRMSMLMLASLVVRAARSRFCGLVEIRISIICS